MGVLGYLVFPWYAQQDANGLLAVGQVFSSEQAANGLMQAALFGRPWLWLGLAGLAVAGLGACLPAGRKQGSLLVADRVKQVAQAFDFVLFDFFHVADIC